MGDNTLDARCSMLDASKKYRDKSERRRTKGRNVGEGGEANV